jgi:hypothetical protein
MNADVIISRSTACGEVLVAAWRMTATADSSDDHLVARSQAIPDQFGHLCDSLADATSSTITTKSCEPTDVRKRCSAMRLASSYPCDLPAT